LLTAASPRQRGVLSTCTRPTLNLLLLLRILRASVWAFTLKASRAPISVECVFSMTVLAIRPEGKTCFDLRRVLVLNDPLTRRSHVGVTLPQKPRRSVPPSAARWQRSHSAPFPPHSSNGMAWWMRTERGRGSWPWPSASSPPCTRARCSLRLPAGRSGRILLATS